MTAANRPVPAPAAPSAPAPSNEREPAATIPAGQRDPRLATEWHI